MTMSIRTAHSKLDEYLDGDLPRPEQQELEALLLTSEELRLELRRHEDLRAATGALPRSIQPTRDLWPSIARRIEDMGKPAASTSAVPDEREAGTTTLPSRRHWRLLAAAALLLMAISAGVTAYLLRVSEPAATGPPAADVAASAWAEFARAERQYQQISADLRQQLEARRDRLSPETLRAVEDNLRLIDQAIQQARQALEQDPSNARLATKITGIYQQQVDFLLAMNRL